MKSLKALLFLYIPIKSGSGYADEGLQDGDKEREVLILNRKKTWQNNEKKGNYFYVIMIVSINNVPLFSLKLDNVELSKCNKL